MKGKMAKFAFGGLLVFGLKTASTVFLTEVLHLWYFAAYVITLVAMMIFTYFYNAYVTFSVTEDKTRTFTRFIVAMALSLALDAAIVRALTDLAKTHYLASIIVSTFFVSAVKYVLYDRFVFRKAREEPPGGNVYDKHHSGNPLVRFLMRRFHQELFRNIALCAPGSLLDAGCGEGYTTALVRTQFPALRIQGLEPDPATVEKARHANPGLEIRQGSIYAIPAHDLAFDLVMATEVLEHLDEPEIALLECSRVSRRFCIYSVPNEPLWRIMNMARFAYLSRLGNTPGHIQHWNREAFGALLAPHYARVSLRTVFIWNIALCEK